MFLLLFAGTKRSGLVLDRIRTLIYFANKRREVVGASQKNETKD